MYLAAEFFVIEIPAQEDRFHGPAKLLQGLIRWMLQVIAGEPAQDVFRLGGPQPQRSSVLDHLVVLLRAAGSHPRVCRWVPKASELCSHDPATRAPAYLWATTVKRLVSLG